MKYRYLIVALAACGGGSTPPPAGDAACTTTFTGNVDETAAAKTACAMLQQGSADAADQVLAVSVTAPASGVELNVLIDLGDTPAPESYSSETVGSWSALGSRTATDGGMCVYSAGNSAVPAGSFTLALTAVGTGSDGPHGTLDLIEYVQAEPMTDCGSGDGESIDIDF